MHSDEQGPLSDSSSVTLALGLLHVCGIFHVFKCMWVQCTWAWLTQWWSGPLKLRTSAVAIELGRVSQGFSGVIIVGAFWQRTKGHWGGCRAVRGCWLSGTVGSHRLRSFLCLAVDSVPAMAIATTVYNWRMGSRTSPGSSKMLASKIQGCLSPSCKGM